MLQNELKVSIKDLLNNLPGMLYRCRYDKEWTMLFVSDGCEPLTGYTKEELLFNRDISYIELIHNTDKDMTYIDVDNALKNKTTFSFEYRIHPKHGEVKWVWEQGVGIYNDSGEITWIEGFITDITVQKNERERLKRDLHKKDRENLINLSLLNEYKKAVDVSSIAAKTNKSGIITYVNAEFCRVSGWLKEEVVGKPHSITRDHQVAAQFFKDLWETILDKRIWKGVISNINKNGERYYLKSTIVPILNINGDIQEFILIGNDVTDLILQERKIKFQTTDFLTKLPNRQKLLEDLQSSNLKLAILNIERFKEINEYFGFDMGDRVLVELAVLLNDLTTPLKMKLYKLHGDEFAIQANHISKENFRDFITKIINKIKTTNLVINKHRLNITMIAGISMQKNYFINAEIALNHARDHKDEVVIFDDDTGIKEKLISNIKWTNKLRTAIDEDRITIFIQPIRCNSTHKIHKYECLVRLIEKDGTIVLPSHFLTVAKKSRLYPEISKTVILKAFKYFKDRDEFFSINLSLSDILNDEIVNLLKTLINESPGIGERLILEIVEDEGIENYLEVNSFIENMKSVGCKIAIDDFGTGYSNFDYLMRLNIDFIKIDGSIIKNIDHDPNAKLITELIIDFSKRLNIKTIAEYVHSESILQATKTMKIDFAQGYFIGKPFSIDS